MVRVSPSVARIVLMWCLGAALATPLSGLVHASQHVHESASGAVPAAMAPGDLARLIEHGHDHPASEPPHLHRIVLVLAGMLVLWAGRLLPARPSLGAPGASAVVGVIPAISRRPCRRDQHLLHCVLLT